MGIIKLLIIFFCFTFQHPVVAQPIDGSQIAATVNGVGIKYSQIAGAGDDRQKISLLESLIREEALYQKALELKFNANSSYLKLLKEEKEKFLIDAFFTIETATQQHPSEVEIDTFISNNPHLFQGRKTWNYSKIQIENNSILDLVDLQNALKLSNDIHNITEWLKKLAVDFEIQTFWLGSEQIGADEYQALSDMALGQIKIISNNKQLSLLQVHQFYEDPRNPEDYRIAVSRGLRNDAIEKKINHIKKVLLKNADYEILLPTEISNVKNISDVARIGDEFIKAENITGPLSRESVIASIENKLVLKQVLKLGLNNKPIIVSGLKTLERRLLIANFLENQLSNIAKPEFQALNNFLKVNPHLFAQRSMYNFSILILKKESKNRITEFEKTFINKNFFEIQSWLKAENLLIATNTLWRGPEKLSIEMLKVLPKMKAGDWSVMQEESFDTVRVLYKHAEHKDPIENQEAIDLARNILVNIEKTRAGRQVVDRVRGQAEVNLMPELQSLIDPGIADRNKIISLSLIAQFMLLFAIIPAIIWLWVRSQAINVYSKRKSTTEVQVLKRFSYTQFFLLSVTVLSLFAMLFSTNYQWDGILDISFTKRALVSSSAIGFSLACLFGLVLLWLNGKKQMLNSGILMLLLNRWWPLVLVIFSQFSILVFVLVNR
jgi:EpsD family peptidyl-prolyl cis-trans isomerase